MRHRLRPTAAPAMCFLAAVGLLTLASPGLAQVEITTRAMDLAFSGRLQFQLQTTSCSGSPPAASACSSEAPALDMFLRRARVSIVATIDERLSLKLEPDFADLDEVSMKDAWGRYTLGTGLVIQAGHFKRPFDGFFLESSTVLPFERAVTVPGVPGGALPSYSRLTKSFDLAERDVGVMLAGTPASAPVQWWLGVFHGGSDADASDSNDGKQVIGRLHVALSEGEMPVGIAGAVAVTDAPFEAADGGTESEYFTNFELFAEVGGWKRAGLIAQLGVVAGDNPRANEAGDPIDLAAGDGFGDLLTWQGVAAWRIALDGEVLEAVTPFVRVSYADPTDRPDDAMTGFTPGIAFYFHGLNRLALAWDVATFEADGLETENSLSAQMQFHF